jgi:hypothetical protein
LFVDLERFFEERLRLVVLPFGIEELGEVGDFDRVAGAFFAAGRAADGQGLAVERLGLGVLFHPGKEQS